MSDHEDGYQGIATLRVASVDIDADVTLRGHFQPIDGRYHWYGRIAADDRLHAVARAGKTAAIVRTPYGEAAGEVSDPDTWGRYRVTGTSIPPFPTGTTNSGGPG